MTIRGMLKDGSEHLAGVKVSVDLLSVATCHL